MRFYMHIILGLLKEICSTFDNAALYILFGIFVAGLIQAFIDNERIAKQLGRPGLRSVLLAALFGIPLPLCSCGVIPTAISLRKNGASKGAVLSFLISTPESGINSIAMSYAMLDPLMTIFRPISAFITAIAAGISENIFGKKDEAAASPEKISCECCGTENKHAPADHKLIQKIKYGMSYAFIDLLGDIAKWLIIGIVIGGIISYFTPANFVERFLGSDFKAMLIMLIIGIPLYICASGSTPIAAALIAKGMSPGVALVFLLAGPGTNIAGILSVGKFLGKRSAVIYLLSISICAVLLGLLLNFIYRASGINIKTTLGHACDMLPQYIKMFSAIALLFLMAHALLRVKTKKSLIYAEKMAE